MFLFYVILVCVHLKYLFCFLLFEAHTAFCCMKCAVQIKFIVCFFFLLLHILYIYSPLQKYWDFKAN